MIAAPVPAPPTAFPIVGLGASAGGLAALDDLQQRGYATFDSSAHAGRGRRWLAAARELLRT